MPSSATTVLRLEKPANGEKSGTWGTIANLNYDMLEASIAGALTISTTSGTVVLTNVDYINDQAKKAVLYCDGALVGSLIIEIPNASKTYRVINNTTNAYTVSVKTNSGSAKTVTQGAAATLYCNGSNTIYYVSPEVVIGTGAPNTAGGAAASSVSVTATGNLSSTNAQAALAELQGDIDTINTSLGNKQGLDADLTAIAALIGSSGAIMYGNGTTWASLSLGTTGLVLRATASAVAWAAGAPSGTQSLFYQNAAPTGWVRNSGVDDYALRTVDSGGVATAGTATAGSAYSSIFAARTLTRANLPNDTVTTGTESATHTHTYGTSNPLNASSGASASAAGGGSTYTTGNASATHTHNFALNGGVTQTPVDFVVKTLNFCVATAS